MALVVDASVWVSAADDADTLPPQAERFSAPPCGSTTPAIARPKVACALSRRLRDAARDRELADGLVQSPLITEMNLGSLLVTALTVETEVFLRAGDAFYAAVATNKDRTIISWDEELLRRANAMTPSAWVTEHGQD